MEIGAATRMLQDARGVPRGFASLSTPVHRASTVLFADANRFAARRDRLYDGYTYGLYGTPTSEALARKLALLESARRVVLAPTGLAAVNLVNFAVLRAGDHLLLSDAMYGPTRDAAAKLFGALGVRAGYYDPGAAGRIRREMRRNTRLVWLESPGTITMEMQDVAAIAATARKHGALSAMDNTWATPLGFRPLAHGVDFSVLALTKHVGGHGDLLLGSVAVRDERWFRRLRDVQGLLGVGAAADDCFLALRGLETLALRLQRQAASALAIARWLAGQPAVGRVLHPGLAGDRGNALWKRDCPGAGSVFTLLLRAPGWKAASGFADRLKLFRLGASWGGVHSLVAVYREPPARARPALRAGAVLRLSIGLEDPEDLIADLRSALKRRSR
jgi:cystathionine beta-lyase